MIIEENDCCECAVPAYPCMGNNCPRRHTPHFYCDKCGDETVLYDTDFGQLCASCLINSYPIIEGSDY